jgi:hypothetical protein
MYSNSAKLQVKLACSKELKDDAQTQENAKEWDETED